MKRIKYLFLVLPLFLFSCTPDEPMPEAGFYADNIKPEVGQKVIFTNDSKNAERFEWDFGDGYTSDEKDPIHIYTGNRSYEVTLTAFSKDGLEDKAKLTIDVMIPTLLEIEVREYFDQYVVPNASVILYPTKTDWDAQTNKVSEGYTDANGIVVFSLPTDVYYVDVWEETHDNYTLASEDVGFITTPEVRPHQINRFVAWVDYVVHSKGVGIGERSVVIKKLERKTTDKPQAAAGSSTENWQELYNRRSGK